MKRRICVITGTRADYGILKPVMRGIKFSKKLELCIVVTCMHLMKEFGNTVQEIKKDGFKVYEEINISYKKDTGQAMAFSVGRAISLFSKCFEKAKPHFVVVLGDRGEMLAASIAANYLNIPVAHIHGGEVSGHVDGLLRHAITKLSQLHFATTKKAGERILKLGEDPWRVFVVGAPALDRILNNQLTSDVKLSIKYKLNKNIPLALIVQHPVSTEVMKAGQQIQNTIKAIGDLKLQTILIYPNADAGGRKMIKMIKKCKNNTLIRSYKNIPHEDYLGLMKLASVLVGNSSSGIIEAPSFKLPVVNIGSRQQGRERSDNVIDVSYDKNSIVSGIKKALYDEGFKRHVKRCKNVYGDGQASKRIVEILSKVKLDKKILQKQITY